MMLDGTVIKGENTNRLKVFMTNTTGAGYTADNLNALYKITWIEMLDIGLFVAFVGVVADTSTSIVFDLKDEAGRKLFAMLLTRLGLTGITDTDEIHGQTLILFDVDKVRLSYRDAVWALSPT